MTNEPRRFPAPGDLEGLSAEGRALVLEARERLGAWIDENVERLEAEMLEALDARRRTLAAEVAALEAEIAEGRRQTTALQERLAALEEDFAAGDGVTVVEAVRRTRDTLQAVHAALDERERSLRGLTEAAVAAGLRTVTGR